MKKRNENPSNKNTIQDSQASAGRDLHVGDKSSQSKIVNYNFQNSAIILSVMLVLTLGLVFGNQWGLFSFQSEDDSSEIPDSAITPPINHPTELEEEKGEEPLEPSPSKNPISSAPTRDRQLIALRFDGVDQELANIATNLIGQQITTAGKKYSSKIDNARAGQALHFSIRQETQTKDLIKTITLVRFQLNATLYQLPDRLALETYNQNSEWIKIENEREIPSKFQSWLQTVVSSFSSIQNH